MILTCDPTEPMLPRNLRTSNTLPTKNAASNTMLAAPIGDTWLKENKSQLFEPVHEKINNLGSDLV